MAAYPYTPAQKTTATNIPTTFNFNMLHTNPPPNIVTPRTLSTPSIPTILTNPLQCNLSSTNIRTTQHSVYPLVHNTQAVTSITIVQNNSVAVPSCSSIRTNPFVTPITQIPTNTIKLQTNTSYSNYHTTQQSTQPLPTVSNPTYINSSASISETIKPFDCLDQKYTPEEYLQRIEARVTFSIGLQPTTPYEYNFWQAKRMAFIQCSLTGTPLSWYILLHDSY